MKRRKGEFNNFGGKGSRNGSPDQLLTLDREATTEQTFRPMEPEKIPSIRGDLKGAAEDFLVAGFGAAASAVTAIILVAVEQRFGIALYTWTFWFVIPAGAICCGFVAASGYYLGAWVFNHRPTRILLLNMVVISVATFFLIHYLTYYFLEVDGKAVRDFISFSEFLDVELTNSAIQFRIRAQQLGTPVELGKWGYLYAVLQICGFALGGVAVYGYLKSLAYCESCSMYLRQKAVQTRYTEDSAVLTNAVSEIMRCLSQGRFQDAVAAHANGAGHQSSRRESILRSQVQIKRCKSCDRHWLKFSASRKIRNDWKDINEIAYEGFSSEPITVGSP